MEYPIQMDDYDWLSGYSLTSYNMIHSYNMHYVLKREAHVCYTVSGIPMDNIWESRIDWLLFRGLATARWFPLYLFTVLLPWQGAIASATAKMFPEAGYQTILGRVWCKLFQGWYSMTNWLVERCFHTPRVPQEILFLIVFVYRCTLSDCWIWFLVS